MWVEGEDVRIVDDNEDSLRNVDELIEERCDIKLPWYGQRSRELCMEFGYFDHAEEVYSDEEGV